MENNRGSAEDDSTCRIGTLGSPLTFAGQATEALRRQRSGYSEPTFFPTMDAVVAAVCGGSIDAGVLTSETSHTACTETAARILAGEPLFIADEIVVPYRCALLGRPGTTLADIRRVGGHGSIRQCQRFLRERLPDAEVQIHAQNSAAAAREVLEGDGTLAVIGTEAAADALGLEIIEADVDDGSVGGWWALTAVLQRAPAGDLIAVRVDGSDELATALAALARSDMGIRTITNAPSGEVFRYRYLVVARTSEGGPVPAEIVDQLGASVVGLFSSTVAP